MDEEQGRYTLSLDCCKDALKYKVNYYCGFEANHGFLILMLKKLCECSYCPPTIINYHLPCIAVDINN